MRHGKWWIWSSITKCAAIHAPKALNMIRLPYSFGADCSNLSKIIFASFACMRQAYFWHIVTISYFQRVIVFLFKQCSASSDLEIRLGTSTWYLECYGILSPRFFGYNLSVHRVLDRNILLYTYMNALCHVSHIVHM